LPTKLKSIFPDDQKFDFGFGLVKTSHQWKGSQCGSKGPQFDFNPVKPSVSVCRALQRIIHERFKRPNGVFTIDPIDS
jgi:hypothetical protein